MKSMLTRYLYFKESVKHSLIFCILKKTTFNECLFWTSEYYYSGYFQELWILIWKIYYDFYAINNPKLEKYIKKMKKKWEEKHKIVYILNIMKNLYYNDKIDPIVFLVRMALETQNVPVKTYRGRPPSLISKIDKKYKNLLMSIRNKHYKNIAYYLRRFKTKESELFNIISQYFTISEPIYKSSYEDKLHILIGTMCHLSLEKKVERNIHLKITNEELKYATKTNSINGIKLYKVLKEKRLFKIRTETGWFERPNDIKNIQWYHWEYFCYKTPVWKERFDKYKINIDHKKYTINFEDDDEYENFYEKYYYEPDEQSKEVQEKSISEIPEISINDWLNNIFDKINYFRLEDKIKYTY